MKKLFLSAIILLFISLNANSQNQKYCGTTENRAKMVKEDPSILQKEAELEIFTKNFIANRATQRSAAATFVIPIVFHIIHDYGTENISDAQVLDAVRILNEDYRKKNADTANIVAGFKSVAGDSQIEFRLAQLDPSGNCTNGIDRIASKQTYIGNDGSKLNYWPRDKYLNVWVVKAISSGAAGYSNYPSSVTTRPTVDGIIILSTYIGGIGTGSKSTSRALTHEAGHYLNLAHTWGSTNDPGVSCGDDNVNDTPETEGWTSCNLSGATCSSSQDNVQNFMDYAYCYCMFTTGQGLRMQAALNSSTSDRNKLWSASNLVATGTNGSPIVACKPKAEFKSNYKTICPGSSITYTDASYNGTVTSRTWTFPGGTPSTSTSLTPVIKYDNPGVYEVTLSVTNSGGTSTTTKTSFVEVLATTAQYNLENYTEGFETSALPNSDWDIISGANKSWERTSAVKYSGGYSMKYDNYPTQKGDNSSFISPSVDLSKMVNPKLYFKVAQAQVLATDEDKLKVYVSTNCGQTWSLRLSKSGSTLATAPLKSGSGFTPSSLSQWRTETISLTSFATYTNAKFKFEFTSGNGNNIYIDDIQIIGDNTLGIDDVSEQMLDFVIYPNPIESSSVIKFNLTEKQPVTLNIYDMVGRNVSTLTNENLPAGEHTVNANQDLSKGVYFVVLTVNKNTFTKKMIIQ